MTASEHIRRAKRLLRYPADEVLPDLSDQDLVEELNTLQQRIIAYTRYRYCLAEGVVPAGDDSFNLDPGMSQLLAAWNDTTPIGILTPDDLAALLNPWAETGAATAVYLASSRRVSLYPATHSSDQTFRVYGVEMPKEMILSGSPSTGQSLSSYLNDQDAEVLTEALALWIAEGDALAGRPINTTMLRMEHNEKVKTILARRSAEMWGDRVEGRRVWTPRGADTTSKSPW